MTQKKLALSLSGGGARAMCYFGVIEALRDNQIKINYISAHSWAAVLLVYIFSGKDRKDIIKDFSQFKFWKFFSLNPVRNGGLINLDRLISYLRNYCGHLQIEAVSPQILINATDITDNNNPQKIIFKQGDLSQAAVASAIVPPLFPLLDYKHKLIADGGFISLYSADDLRDLGADVVIGLFPDGLQYTKMPEISFNLSTVIKSLNSARNKFEEIHEPVDFVLTDFDSEAGLNDFHLAQEMFDSGYRKTMQNLNKVCDLLQVD